MLCSPFPCVFGNRERSASRPVRHNPYRCGVNRAGRPPPLNHPQHTCAGHRSATRSRALPGGSSDTPRIRPNRATTAPRYSHLGRVAISNAVPALVRLVLSRGQPDFVAPIPRATDSNSQKPFPYDHSRSSGYATRLNPRFTFTRGEAGTELPGIRAVWGCPLI